MNIFQGWIFFWGKGSCQGSLPNLRWSYWRKGSWRLEVKFVLTEDLYDWLCGCKIIQVSSPRKRHIQRNRANNQRGGNPRYCPRWSCSDPTCLWIGFCQWVFMNCFFVTGFLFLWILHQKESFELDGDTGSLPQTGHFVTRHQRRKFLPGYLYFAHFASFDRLFVGVFVSNEGGLPVSDQVSLDISDFF